MTKNAYVPALRFHALTGLYDALVAILCREKAFKAALVAQAALSPGQNVLDLGSGTGTMTLALKRDCPGAFLLGVDADPNVLERAQAKALRLGSDVTFLRGFAQDLDPDLGPFDRVVTSLFLHHIPASERKAVLDKVRNSLKEEGELHIADWDRPANALQWIGFTLVRILDGWELTRGHAEGRMEEWLRQADFQNVTRTRTFHTPLGTLSLWSAKR
ncbi:MAG: class I SAM-dependent methyltransferase [Holophagaceae bacterium]|nr:class I SAM-dependent methyltransferase [Holophagaceae bacterium]